MDSFRLLSKDETFDPGVNLDSSDDSDHETLNNNVRQTSSSDQETLRDTALHNDLSCQCTGIKCICDEDTEVRSFGGPNADPPKSKGATGGGTVCQGHCTGLAEKDKGSCLRDGSKSYHKVSNKVFICRRRHENLCDFCYKHGYCPICGPASRQNKGM